MRPTGRLHLGNLAGVLENWVSLQDEYENFHLVADWHALTTEADQTADLAENTRQMVIDWLAGGIDPARSPIFIQSHVPGHAELHLILSMLVTVPRLERNPAVKEQARALHLEHVTGSLEVGKVADLVVWPSDPTAMTPQQMATAALEMTMVGGEVVHEIG